MTAYEVWSKFSKLVEATMHVERCFAKEKSRSAMESQCGQGTSSTQRGE